MLQTAPSLTVRELTTSLVGVADAVVVMPRRGGGSGMGLVSDAELGEFLRAAQHAVEVTRVAIADALAEFTDRAAYRDDGASSISGWAESELHLDGLDARRMVRAHSTMRNLPEIGSAARSGEIGLDHVQVLTGAIARDGLDEVEAVEPVLVDVARKAGPDELRQTVRKLHEVLSPEQLDDAYEKGMDKHDIKVSRVGDGDDAGYAVTGWLDNLTGTRFRTWLDAASAPRPSTDHATDHATAADSTDDPAADERTAAQRRVDAFGDLIDSALRHGMPHDRGIRPQLLITVDADTLLRAARAARDTARADTVAGQNPWQPQTDAPFASGTTTTRDARLWWPFGPLPVGLPADLAGHGLIGPALLGMFACEADITAILVRDKRGVQKSAADDAADDADDAADGKASAVADDSNSLAQADVLNVGRTHRLATPRQRRAVLHRQGGVCGNPTCSARHLDIHHVAWWDRDHGPTDLDNLIALCSRCHALVHTGQLIVAPDGHGSFTITTGRGRPIHDTNRRLSRWIRQRLRQALADPPSV